MVAGVALVVVEASCLDRPVISRNPLTQTNFTTVVNDTTVDKIDILFVIDNSASMGDKQAYLAEAVPNLITRLVTPNCVDATGTIIYGPSDAQGMGMCAQGKVEFPPVHDMHIGVISTSLGSRLSDQVQGASGIICDPTQTVMVNGATLSNHNDDRAELLNRSGAAETPLADAGSSNYLNWFPSTNPKNAGKSPSAGAPAISNATQLISDFTSLIQGVGNYGCGIESQLESWYRFLVQPDPYASLSLDSNSHAQWVGVDTTILQQRQNFLRPDSLVAIIDMTDENDSEIDLRSVGGQGYLWMSQNFDPPHGTSACAENAANSGLTSSSTCESCVEPSAASDPSCQAGNDDYSADNDWGYNPNLRHVHMEQKYGIWPQFPIQRYVTGLTSKTVPDRNGEYPPNAQSYQGTQDCTNPLFAASLPDGSSTDAATLCNLPVGTRTPDLIYYADIGGVPHQLLQQDPTNPDSPPKETLAPSDWTLILGNDPLSFDYTGIDPHMIESYQPRTGIATPTAAGPPATLDPYNGYDWVTDQGGDERVLAVDREYACTFPLTTPRDCTKWMTDPVEEYSCDCPATTGLTPQQLPPICNPTTPTQQIGAKAYPTQRELLLAQLMGLQGIVSSLCPIHVQPAAGDTIATDPLYGYNPAVNAIVDRLKVSLNNACLPQKLTPDMLGNLPCLVLVQLATPAGPGSCANPGSACNNSLGLLGPGDIPEGQTQPTVTADILTKFCQAQEATYPGTPGGPGDPDTYPTCALQQLTTGANGGDGGDFVNGSCASSRQPGWCYVTGAAANGCPQAILFTSTEPPPGALASLQCIEQSVTVLEGGGAAAPAQDGGGE